MTAPAYGTDLQDVSVVDDNTGWSELSGRTSGGADAAEDRAYIQGNGCVSQSTGVATGRTTGMEYDYGSNVSWTSGWVFLFWQFWQAPKAIGTWADGGMRAVIGSSSGNYNLWNAQGNDFGRNPYGGWGNVAIDPEYTPDEVVGSPVAGNYRIFGSAPYILSAVSKGNPHCVDAIRYGRGLIKAEYGSAGDGYANFVDMAAANDADSARWGLFALQFGSYLWKGLMSIGTTDNPVEFTDANRNIVIDECPRTYADFNKIEIWHSDSVVNWTNIFISALGALAKGRFECVDAADVNIDGCTFKNMDTFIFLSSCDVLNSAFLSCGVITANGAKFNGTKFNRYEGSTGSSYLLWNTAVDTDGKLDGCQFTKGTAATHAINLGASSPTEITLRNCVFSGYNASNDNDDSTVYVSRDAGTVIINLVGCSGNFTYKSAGATVSVVNNPVTVKVTVRNASGAVVSGARVLVKASDGTGPFPFEETVTIVNSGTTATVTHTGHGMLSNDYVVIAGASHEENNGVFQITKINDNSYSYVMSSAPGSSPTGTIKATFVALYGVSDGSGIVTTSRVYSDDQPITGWARKSSSSPLYKPGSVAGSVDAVIGLNTSITLIQDE